MANVEWYEDYRELGSFASVLYDADEFDDVSELLYYIEKPYKWDTEHDKWEEMGNPSSDDDEWDEFKAILDSRGL